MTKMQQYYQKPPPTPHKYPFGHRLWLWVAAHWPESRLSNWLWYKVAGSIKQNYEQSEEVLRRSHMGEVDR